MHKYDKITVDEFYERARANMVDRPQWRYGQSLFNTLLGIRPDLAEQIRGTEIDPFHARGGTDDPRLYKFGEFVNREWDKP